MSLVLEPIGMVRSSRADVRDDDWDGETCAIVLADRFAPDALAGLDTFSHVEIVFVMDRMAEASVHLGARRPRDRAEWPAVGIFAQRAKARPNRLGVTVCRVLGVTGRTLRVAGLDAVDGSPVLDVKPWVIEFGPRGAVHQPAWMTELMAGYWGSGA